jgi:hypothetical protein
MAARGDKGITANTTVAIRGGLIRGLRQLEEAGRPLSTIWKELFEDDPATAMRLAISTMPKEVDMTAVELTPEQWLERMADASEPEGT